MIINLQDSIIKDYGTNRKVLFFYALRMLFSFLLCKFKLSDWSDIRCPATKNLSTKNDKTFLSICRQKIFDKNDKNDKNCTKN